MGGVTKRRIDSFVKHLKDRGLSGKTINNNLIPLRLYFDDLVQNEELDKSPLRNITNVEVARPIPDPLTEAEYQAVMSVLKGAAKNFFQFACWTGLRTSELIALLWSDVDLERGIITVSRAKVRGRVKGTKTAGSTRNIEATAPAIEALRNQREFTYLQQREVFLNPNTGRPFSGDKPVRETFWKPALKKAGVRYRKAYCTRHTFISLALSYGCNPNWVAQQAGHVNTAMVWKHYGKYIRTDRVNVDLLDKMAEEVLGVSES